LLNGSGKTRATLLINSTRIKECWENEKEVTNWRDLTKRKWVGLDHK
jgi:hypothetical protein